jgi:hypothetical protein
MWRRVAPLAVLALLVAPAPAIAGGGNAGATSTAIQAYYALARVRVGMIAGTQSKIEAYRHKLAGECPNAGAGSPESEAAEPMSAEVADALWSIDYGAVAGPIAKFAAAIRPLHWTSASFNDAIHTLSSSLSGLAAVRLPDLCTDIRSWTASGFKTVPPGVLALDQRVEPLRLPEIPWRLVRRYERGSEASHVAYIEGAEQKLGEAEFELGQKDWYQLLETVGLAP